MRFLFRIGLSLHADAENFFWNFDFGNQTRPKFGPGCMRRRRLGNIMLFKWQLRVDAYQFNS